MSRKRCLVRSVSKQTVRRSSSKEPKCSMSCWSRTCRSRTKEPTAKAAFDTTFKTFRASAVANLHSTSSFARASRDADSDDEYDRPWIQKKNLWIKKKTTAPMHCPLLVKSTSSSPPPSALASLAVLLVPLSPSLLSPRTRTHAGYQLAACSSESPRQLVSALTTSMVQSRTMATAPTLSPTSSISTTITWSTSPRSFATHHAFVSADANTVTRPPHQGERGGRERVRGGKGEKELTCMWGPPHMFYHISLTCEPCLQKSFLKPPRS